MPGIAGIISRHGKVADAASLDAMVRCLMHEEWYTSGTYMEERLGLSVGWVNHGGSFSDCQPVWNESRDVCLIFSGEDFRGQPEIDALRSKGHRFEPGNASYLVHLYEELGDKFLEQLNGLFCGVLVDLRRQRAVLFNDRYGVSRIYFHENERGLYFASEAKALLKVLPDLRRLDLQSLGEFFSCGCVLQNRTLFTGISLLPGGAAWSVTPGAPLQKGTYFNPRSWEEQSPLDATEYYRKLRETWERILPGYLNGKLPLALSLTGGLDSRMILAWARRPADALPCYTFGGMYRDCVDVKVARQIAGICGRSHHTIRLDHEFLDSFPKLVERSVYLTDGTLDPTGAVDLFVQRKARQIAPVRVTGLYGGEILRSLVVFKPAAQRPAVLSGEFAPRFEKAAGTYAEETRGHQLSFIAFKQAPWFIYPRLALERSQLTLRTPYFDNALVALAYRAPRELAASKEIGLRLIADGNPALKAVSTDRGIPLNPVPGVTLARQWYQEFTLKAEYAYDSGMPQWLARIDKVFRPLSLDKLFLGRHKVSQFRIWYRDKFGPYLKDMLLDSRARRRPYLDGAGLEKLVTQHVSGERNYTSDLHRLLGLEILQRELID